MQVDSEEIVKWQSANGAWTLHSNMGILCSATGRHNKFGSQVFEVKKD